MKKVCKNCQYLRPSGFLPDFQDHQFCSNSKSPKKNSYIVMPKTDTCNQFSKRGKKAPLWMRLAKKVMK